MRGCDQGGCFFTRRERWARLWPLHQEPRSEGWARFRWDRVQQHAGADVLREASAWLPARPGWPAARRAPSHARPAPHLDGLHHEGHNVRVSLGRRGGGGRYGDQAGHGDPRGERSEAAASPGRRRRVCKTAVPPTGPSRPPAGGPPAAVPRTWLRPPTRTPRHTHTHQANTRAPTLSLASRAARSL